MSDRAQLILFFSVATFVIVVFIAVVLVKRHGHTVETKKILDAIQGGRQQMSAEHSAFQSEQRGQAGILKKMLERLGFMR